MFFLLCRLWRVYCWATPIGLGGLNGNTSIETTLVVKAFYWGGEGSIKNILEFFNKGPIKVAYYCLIWFPLWLEPKRSISCPTNLTHPCQLLRPTWAYRWMWFLGPSWPKEELCKKPMDPSKGFSLFISPSFLPHLKDGFHPMTKL